MESWEDTLTEAYNRYLIAAARFEGVIEAHKILKGGSGDFADELLWNMAADIAKEAERVRA